VLDIDVLVNTAVRCEHNFESDLDRIISGSAHGKHHAFPEIEADVDALQQRHPARKGMNKLRRTQLYGRRNSSRTMDNHFPSERRYVDQVECILDTTEPQRWVMLEVFMKHQSKFVLGRRAVNDCLISCIKNLPTMVKGVRGPSIPNFSMRLSREGAKEATQRSADTVVAGVRLMIVKVAVASWNVALSSFSLCFMWT
jgi:hypothetical protein